MSDTFNWLHVSDLHLGQSNQPEVWPNVRQAFFEDLKRLHERCGPWHAVVFSGDLTFSAQAHEFKTLEEDVLGRIFEELGSLGSRDATLLAVPGNHDLERPDAEKPTAALRQLLREGGFEEIEEEFWADQHGEYGKIIAEAFANYNEWWSRTGFRRKCNIKEGILPGDFAATLRVNNHSVGVIGLNTTFLQLAPGNYQGRLVWDPRQVQAVCGDVADWTANHDARLLITHQGPAWLTDGSQSDYPEINPAGRFAAHLFGHLHKNDLLELTEAAGGGVRRWQAASLFGLESVGDLPVKERRHGFMAGRIEFGANGATIRCWPRAGTKDANGWRFIPDHERGVLEDDDGTKFELLPPGERQGDDGGDGGDIPRGTTPTDSLPFPGELVPIEQALEQASAREHLQAVAKYPLKAEDPHREVRKEEQTTFELILRRQRVVWIVADWGLGKEGFVAAALERLHIPSGVGDVYRLRCDEIDTVNGVFAAAERQFGLPFQKFCAFAAALPDVALILDEVPLGFSRGTEAEAFSRLIKTTLDYCPNLLVIVTSRQVDDSVKGGAVQLKPLDAIDVKKFLRAARPTATEFDDPDILERIHVWSGGLPIHLTRLLEMVEISSLADILAEGELYSATPNEDEPVPRQLQRAVATLANSGNEYSRRSFRLLKVLTVLTEGETIQSIKRFYPSQPFHLQNATELMRLSLLELGASSTPIGDFGPTSSTPQSEKDVPKILRVPRQVRDYVRTLIPEEERAEIIHSSTELLFGRKWREGKIHLRGDLPSFTGGSASGSGNEHTIIRYLLAEALTKRNAAMVKRCARLGIQYGSKLARKNRYRDATLVAADLVRMLEGTTYDEECVEAGAIYGRGLRMTGHRVEAVKVLQTALEKGEAFLSKDTQASLNLGIALAQEAEDEKDPAVAAAQRVLELVAEESAYALQAKGIIVAATVKKGYEQQRQLSELERTARQKKFYLVANNLALDLAKMTTNVDESLRLHKRVLDERTDSYNHIRAVIDKAQLLQSSNRLSDLSSTDRKMLSSAYSYSYGQRMGSLFDRCHKVLWGVLAKENLFVQLVRLFRHSSFLWRLKGSEAEEVSYLRDLDKIDLGRLAATEGRSLQLEIHYLEGRRQEVGAGSHV